MTGKQLLRAKNSDPIQKLDSMSNNDLFLLLMFEHPEHTKMTFRIKFKVNMDDI